MTISTAALLEHALWLGFDAAAVIPIAEPNTAEAFSAWLDAGHHGEMRYMADREALRLDPRLLSPEGRSMIVTQVNYHLDAPLATWRQPLHGRIARYAWAQDYHETVKALLFRLDAFLRDQTGRTVQSKACVDTAPLLERDAAVQSGLGFWGRNTCLITQGVGSWAFLGELLVHESLEAGLLARGRGGDATGRASRSATGTCGRCTRCLEACPTGAFVAPYVLDSRRCISYLTIELRGAIPTALRPLMGNWVFGCDICQEVCPYNHRPLSADSGVLHRQVEPVPRLTDLLHLDEPAFRNHYRGTAVLRTKRRGLVRNACIAAGNAGDVVLVSALAPLLNDSEPLVRGHAAWALGRIRGSAGLAALRRARGAESDAYVIGEIEQALAA